MSALPVTFTVEALRRAMAELGLDIAHMKAIRFEVVGGLPVAIATMYGTNEDGRLRILDGEPVIFEHVMAMASEVRYDPEPGLAEWVAGHLCGGAVKSDIPPNPGVPSR